MQENGAKGTAELTADALRRRIDMEQLAIELATRFLQIEPNEVDAGIQLALGRLGRFAGADRCTLFQRRADTPAMRGTHQWHAPGTPSSLDKLQALPGEDFPGWVERIEGLDEFRVDAAHPLPPEAANERGLLSRVGIGAFVAAPILVRGEAVGFVVAATTERQHVWPEETATLLRMVGNVIAAALTFQRAHQELSASGERYRVLVENSVDIAYSLNVDGELTYIGPQLARYGLSTDQVSGSRFWDAVVPEDRPLARLRLQKSLESGDELPFEFRIRASDGSQHWLEDRRSVMRDESGAVVGVSGVLRDVSLRKEAEQREQQHAQELLFLAVSAMALVKLGPDEDLYRFVADCVHSIVGGQHVVAVVSFDDQASSYRLRAMAGPEHLVRAAERFLEGLRGGVAGPVRAAHAERLLAARLQRYDDGLGKLLEGTVPAEAAAEIERLLRVGEVHTIGLARGELILGALAILVPIGQAAPNPSLIEAFAGQATVALERRRSQQQLRETEAQLRHSQKMEAIGELAGGVAHDFNNLLAAILGYSDLALRELPAGGRVWEAVEQIRAVSQRAAALTNQLLVFARKQVLAPRVVDLNRSVVELERMVALLVEPRIELRVRLDPHPCAVHADPAQLQQMLLNLVMNARDAMPDGGRLTLRTTRQTLSEEEAARLGLEPGTHMLLEVEDTGIGMDPETLARIFEPFFTTKPAGEGTGLGLSTVFGIVNQAGGHIEAVSPGRRGTTFRIHLPCLARELVANEEAEPVEHDPGGSETVLVVEDATEVRIVLAKILESAGYLVLEASCGDDGLRVAREHQGAIDLLLTDAVMPRMSGFDLAARLEEDRPDIRVLVVSGHARGSPELAGSRPYLAKPFTAAELLARVKEVLHDSP